MKKLSLLSIAFLAICMWQCQSDLSTSTSDRKWWKEAIVYQLYPRSFKDSDGDGIGDLKGIISKLDYLQSLGITAVWLNPIYESPNDDNGYDISDYRNIMKEFGTMEDFDALLAGLHQRNIKLVMDVVVNHSSDEHFWFQESRKSRDNPYRNYYHWWNADRGKPAPRYSLFDINHDAWKYDSLTDAYYLHYFSRKQPDLNWENPKLRQEVYDIMKFWADKGVDGFRLDAFGFASKDITFPIFPEGYEKNFMLYYSMGPHLHEYLKEMNEQVFSKYNVMSVAEGAGNTMEDAHNLVDEDRRELDMAYAFEAVDIAKYDGYRLAHFKEVFSRWDSAFADKGWLSIFLANHDQARMVSRFGNDKPEFRDVSSKMLSTFIMTMRGTPYYYNGDELGMTNAGFEKIEDYRDMPTLNEYQHQIDIGGDLKKFMTQVSFGCRDNGRTNYQWDTTANAGFTEGTPWIKTNSNYKEINAAQQENDPGSCLNYFRKLVDLRKNNIELVYGKYTQVDKSNPSVYAYTREYEGKKDLILLNFTDKSADVNTGVSSGSVLLNNYDTVSTIGPTMSLRPYEAIVLRIE
jgi:oligo-1,6-glucosidase